MIELQYDFFKDPMESRLSEMEKTISDTRLSLDKQRKAQFAKIGEMRKIILDLEQRFAVLEANICKKKSIQRDDHVYFSQYDSMCVFCVPSSYNYSYNFRYGM